MPDGRLAVLGCGNILMRDDGLGVRAIERLRESGVPPDVDLIDAGTALLDVLPSAADADRMILVDVVRAGGEPGTIYRLALAELEKMIARPGPTCSLHDFELHEAFSIARFDNPELGGALVVGMEPASIEVGTELSQPVERAMPKLLETIMDEIVAPRSELR